MAKRDIDEPGERALREHPRYRGKIQIVPKCAVRSLDDFSVWYTPGVAAPCKAIAKNPELVFAHTGKGNTIAIVTDGTRVLGLGDIGPMAGLPVMEGKALLFKYLGGVDAVPICLGTKDQGEIVRIVKALEPSFGGINLEDIEQPKCFRVLEACREACSIPVWHDDQQGSATVALAAVKNALRRVGKQLSSVKIAMIGMGAANYSTYRLLAASGVDLAQLVGCDSRGTLHVGREELARDFPEKWRVCRETNADHVPGGIAEALRDADVCIAFAHAGPGTIRPEWIGGMAKDAIVLACANPVPEIWPWEAQGAGACIVATGRGDLPNQVNNALAFPGIFRGVLDVRARTITDTMALAASDALAARGAEMDRVLPPLDDIETVARVAVAVGRRAREEGLAGIARTDDDLRASALEAIRRARETTSLLLREGIIADML